MLQHARLPRGQESTQKGAFQKPHDRGIAFENSDVHRHTRIFLDGRSEADAAGRLLGATNLFNVKRLWLLDNATKPGQPVAEVLQAHCPGRVDRETRPHHRGTVRGEGRPGAPRRSKSLWDPIFEYMKTHFYMTQGDERGSHYMMLVPKPLSARGSRRYGAGDSARGSS